MRNSFYILFAMLSLLLGSCSSDIRDAARVECADSLCVLLDEYRYKSVERLSAVADELLAMKVGDRYDAIAKTSLAYSALMHMDYRRAKALYSEVSESSHSEIEALMADVGMMILCYRVSANREFFDYRAMALDRMRRIEDEVDYLPSADKARFVRAKIELEIVSICYFSNIGLVEESQISREVLTSELEECDDVALRIYVHMMLAAFETDFSKRLDAYVVGLSLAKRGDYTWLTGNYHLLLAIALRGVDVSSSLPESLEQLNSGHFSSEELSLSFAGRAVGDFLLYGDNYMGIEAIAVEASCNTQLGRYGEALALLGKAVDSVNAYYKTCNVGDTLSLGTFAYFDDTDESSFLQDSTIVNIPECLLSIRREASCAYAGLGDKTLSDINREAYLDLLRTTRMNRQMESRVQAATSTAKRLYWWALLVVVAFVVVAFLFWVLGRRLRRRDEAYSENLRRLLNLSRNLISFLPRELESEEEVCTAVGKILAESFSGEIEFSIIKPFEPDEIYSFVYSFPLPRIDASRGYTLYAASAKPLDEEKETMIEMALPYVAAAVEEGLRIADISDEHLRLEEQRLAHELYVAQYKRDNLLKRVSLSVVGGMRPYMDRISNELRHLLCEEDKGVVERRLQYVAELADKLDDFNLILERWIKMRRGEVHLQLERFSVSEVFDIIEKSIPYFKARGIELKVCKGDAILRADRALTLFMVNTLVENAGKFTPSGGSIVVAAEEREGYVELSVTDSGVGLSQCDIDRILGEKVYNVATIGDVGDLSGKNKGGGFGLMNCKGIIEKYRKTDELFSVCRMDITSSKGKGSRFSFRLPSGVVRCVVALCVMLSSLSAVANDAIFERVNAYADSVFNSNVAARYDSAYIYAEKALAGLNEYYRTVTGGVDTLSLSSGSAAEIRWWREGVFPLSQKENIFFNILDIRNELAVAALATQRWADYRYNNGIYASLYRLVHDDKGLDEHYENMRRLANYRQAAIALLLCLIVLMVVAYIITYVRHGVIGRISSRMLLLLNRRLLLLTSVEVGFSPSELSRSMLKEIFEALGESMCIDRVAMYLLVDGGEGVAEAYPQAGDGAVSTIYMRSVCESITPFVSDDKLLLVLPMYVSVGGEKHIVGAIEFASGRPLGDSEVLNIELVARYAASVAYHSTVRMAGHYKGLAAMEEDAERVKFEENRLHVQNMVMDNCLSVIKHETLYYPSRIKNIVAQAMQNSNDVALCREKVSAMAELMDYYVSVFGILSNCASRQLDDGNLHCSQVALNELFVSMQGYVARRAKKISADILLTTIPTALEVACDKVLLEFLVESLLDASLSVNRSGELLLCAVDAGDVVRVELLDKRLHLSKDELSLLFVPSRRNLADGANLTGMEYLVAKEVMRLHEDALMQRGGRIEARATDEGVVILFTLPKKSLL